MEMDWRGAAVPFLISVSMLAGFAATLLRFG
jgi:hypothetical protein